ncbi:MAG: DDE-type integrase/transposase/recombinase [Xanthomonadales bacterium]|nr:DDE-type integrase/transposase/recombinase [Xanthomonadales bacterium]
MNALANAPAGLSKQRICHALGQPRHRCYPDDRQRHAKRTGNAAPRRLTVEQDKAIMDCLHSERFCDASPRHVFAQLLSEGTVLASISTFYRRLRAAGQSTARRLQRPPQCHAKPQLIATAPHQVWTWDITKLPTFSRGVYLCLYLILDLFSRYVVGWMISRKENAGLAKHLFTRTLAAHAIAADTLIVHQDRGSPMTAHCFTDLLVDMGVQRSHSRPRVSNDTPFSESQFKTIKFAPNYPGRFTDAEHAREWLRGFLAYYNERPHEGLALFTPADVFHGRVTAVAAIRQRALDEHYARFPQRYVNGPPCVRLPPNAVHINPDLALDGQQLIDTTGSMRNLPTPVDTTLPEVVT